MPIKLSMPDETPKGRRRLANAKGQTAHENNNSGQRKFAPSGLTHQPITRNAQFAGGGANVAISQPMFFSPLHTPQNWQIASRRKEIYQWARFYYENEPKVAAGVDFYAQFPMNGFEVECKNKQIRRYYENLVKELKLNYWLKLVSHEYFLLGDVFPFLEIECKHCGGRGRLPNGKPCNHPDGKFKSITILNPDFIEIEDSPFPEQRALKMVPDDAIKKIVATGEPRAVYDRIPEQIKNLVMSGKEIPLSSRSASHIKHSEVPYAKYGTSLLRRLFTILAYKTKLMTANWIVAERLVLPVRVVKLGEKDRPAGPDDIADMQQQMSAVANDPNLTIVTHHAFDYEWYGATGKIHNIQGEMEQIGKEILDGLMLNQALLNGEMQGYTSAQVGIETLIKRLETWRHTLADWVEEHIFKPTAMMQGFVDEEATKELGKTVYLYPTIKWNDMQLRDKTNKLQMFMQLHDKGLISTETLLNEFDIDYDTEIERIRHQQAVSSPAMAGGAGAGAMPGGAGGGMSGGVGAPGGGPMPGGDMGGGAGGAPPMGGGGGMGGAPMGGGGGMGGAPMGAAAGGSPSKVFKKGKAPKGPDPEDMQQTPPTFVKLTRIEQKLWKMLQQMQLPFQLFGQYKQPVYGEQQPFVMDFAFPEIQVDIETDGEIWHDRPGQKQKDAERDRKLAANGWRVIRFTEDAINDQLGEVQKVIQQNIHEASEERFSQRKKASGGELFKYAEIVGDEFEESNLRQVTSNTYYKFGSAINGEYGAIVQVIKRADDEQNLQSQSGSFDGGPQEDQRSGYQMERDLQGQIEVLEETV